MAFGLRCKRCGHQETAHTMPEHYPDVCSFYESPDKRLEKKMWKQEREEEAEREAFRSYRGPAYDH